MALLAEGRQAAGRFARAAYFNEKFDTKLTETERLEKLVDAYRKDSENPETKEPLRLLMGYLLLNGSCGTRRRPGNEGENKAIRETDGVLEKIVGEVSDIFKAAHASRARGQAIHPDHDRSRDGNDRALVSLKHAMGRWNTPDPDPVRALWSGSLANIYLNNVPGPEREGKAIDFGELAEVRLLEMLDSRGVAGEMGIQQSRRAPATSW